MNGKKEWRAGERGVRPARVANCSGYHGDPAGEMYKQATLGDVDFITGDYLAEVNMAGNAEAHAQGNHPGYEETAWEGLRQTIDVIAEKQIKIAINGGALNPQGLARKVAQLVEEKGHDLRVACVSGDDVLPQIGKSMPREKDKALPHLDSTNDGVTLTSESFLFAQGDKDPLDIVSAHAYLGAHTIFDALDAGADIVICGRVSDASPVMACAWYWWSWNATKYDELAGALVAGHLIECSAYVTGGNFAGFDAFDLDDLINPGFPIAEIDKDGTCIITKHAGTGGMVNVDTCRSQLLYELQGNVYLNSDVKAHLDHVSIEQIGEDRVRVSGIRGAPPPETTKLAIFYKGGYEMQALFNATGYATDAKFDLFTRQIKYYMGDEAAKKLDVLEFQQIGRPAPNPSNQNTSTSYFRIFAQSTDVKSLGAIVLAVRNISLKHFSGFHSSLDMRTAAPRSYLAYYPALWHQDELHEAFHFVDGSSVTESHARQTSRPTVFEKVGPRESYDTKSPIDLLTLGECRRARLGDICLGRSGDKGANLNFGLFVQTPEQWDWLRSYMTLAKARELIGDEDWKDEFSMERVEFPNIFSVHFVVYGILGRGVSSSKRLDGFGKGFIDYFRDKVVDVPVSIL